MTEETTGQVVTGVFTLVGALLGGVTGLLGERWSRTWGKVVCKLDWSPTMSTYSAQSPSGHHVTQRSLKVTFLNRKDVPVTVWGMRVVFYNGARPLAEEERPHLEIADAEGGPEDPVTLPPRVHVTRTLTLNVAPGRNEALRQRAVEEADRIEFVAVLEGARDKSEKLALWGSQAP